MNAIRKLTILGVVVAATACNEAVVPDYNAVTAFPHTVASLQNEFSGVFNAPRNPLTTDMFWFELVGDGFARTAAYFTTSEQRFVTQYTGRDPLDKDNFGARVWDSEFTGVKIADTVIAILPTLKVGGAAVDPTEVAGLTGVLQTEKALFYMYVAYTRDTLGVPVGSPGRPFTNPAPILCAPGTWSEIVALLDSAAANLTTLGAGQLKLTGTNFILKFPPTYNGASVGGTGASFTGASFLNFTLALRARAHLELAYAISRASPDPAQLDSAIADVQASGIYSPTLSAAEAVAANDVGVFHAFSPSSGDVQNPIFGSAPATYALKQFVAKVDTLNDQRFLAKFAKQTPTTATGADIASDWAYLNNIGTSTPVPIVRNVELQFVLARAYLGKGDFTTAFTIVNGVRTAVGGLAPAANPGSVAGVQAFLLDEQEVSLALDATDDQMVALRDYGAVMANDTTWPSDQHTSVLVIPQVESDSRGGKTACQ